MNKVNFKAADYNTEYKKRLKNIATGTVVSSCGAFLYYKSKNYSGKKLWINTIETGAAFGLLFDIAHLLANIAKNINTTPKKY